MRRFMIFGLISGMLSFGLYQIGYANDLSFQQRNLLERLYAESGDSFRVTWNEETHTPSFLSGRLTTPSKHTPEWIGYTALDKVKLLYGMNHPARTLKPVKVETDGQGRTFVHYQHLLFDVPVWGDLLVVEIDQTGVVRSIRGQFYPNLEGKLFGRPMKSAVSMNAAAATAATFVKSKGVLVGEKEPNLKTCYLPTRPGTPLVYIATFQAPGPGQTEQGVIIHALTGKVIETFRVNSDDSLDSD